MTKPDGDSFLGDIEELLNNALGEPAGTRALMDVCDRHRGETVYVTSRAELFLRWRNERIRAAFRGANHAELALEWGLSIRQVRRVLIAAEE